VTVPSRTADKRRRVRLHENLTLLEVADPAQLEELRDLPEARAAIVRVLSPKVVVLNGDRLSDLLRALDKHDLIPRVCDVEP
jgi:hypothetical protein